ncbi:hypothetical protein evm_006348 [Chilo suppressalis]|nr:hypothetical protein evm_006348 [Chilo suppressalis]
MKNKLYQKAFIDLGCAHTTDINIARFEKFCKTFKAKSTEEPLKKTVKNYDPSTLPPCKAELHQQLLRAQYVTSIWRNAHLRFPSNLEPTEHGWQLKEDKLDFYWFDGDCMPQLVIDAIHPGTFGHSDENATDNEEEFIELNSMDEFTSDEEIPSDIDE